MSLLIVEDDEEVRKVLIRIAQRYFDKVSEAENAYTALIKISSENPGVVLTDWDLGGKLTGIDIANYVSASCPDCRLVFITGKSMTQLKARTIHLNVHTYLAKPFSLENFRSVLIDILQADKPVSGD